MAKKKKEKQKVPSKVKVKSKLKQKAKGKAEVLSSKLVFQSSAFDVYTDQVIEPCGREARRDIVRHNGSVVILALEYSKSKKDPLVGYYGSWIQAAFLIGWALGGGFFGRVADRLGRSRALMLTILTYALFTGLSAVAQTWWQLLVLRFLAALGIGGEWAVGAALLSETWPRRWRPWMAAVL